MRATLMYGAGDVRVETVPDPELKEPTDAVVRVLLSCICGSDLWPYGSLKPSAHGRRMGHEFLGVIEDLGSDVSRLKRGDLVVAPFVWSDGTCDFCREGLQTSCRNGGQGEAVRVPQAQGTLMRNLTLTGGVAPARAYIEELMPDIPDGTFEPGRLLDRTIGLDDVPDGYRAMADREALKVLIQL